MITEERCKQYLISNGWKFHDGFFIHPDIPDTFFYVRLEYIIHVSENCEFNFISHNRGQSINYIRNLHHTFDRKTFGRGKLPK